MGHMVALTQFLSSCLEVKTLYFLIARSFTWMLLEAEVDWEVPDISCEKTALRKGSCESMLVYLSHAELLIPPFSAFPK